MVIVVVVVVVACACGACGYWCDICRSVRNSCFVGGGGTGRISRPIDIYLAAGDGEREALGRLIIGVAPIEYLVHGRGLASVICVRMRGICCLFRFHRERVERSERYGGANQTYIRKRNKKR